MKRLLTLVMLMVFVMAFSLTVTVEKAQSKYTCCVYYNWCGNAGWGSWVSQTCYDQLGKPYPCPVCTYLVPGQKNYNPKCEYRPAAACNVD